MNLPKKTVSSLLLFFEPNILISQNDPQHIIANVNYTACTFRYK